MRQAISGITASGGRRQTDADGERISMPCCGDEGFQANWRFRIGQIVSGVEPFCHSTVAQVY